MSRSSNLFFCADEDEGLNNEEELLKKFQTMLQGVPPPSSVTMSKLTVTDMLFKYKENVDFFGIKCPQVESSNISCTKNLKSLVYYLNSSNVSEEIAHLSQKVQFRYIYSETMSSCNIWFDSVIKSSSAKKQFGRKNGFGFGLSPGSRLSHLARRRQIFSCENLQQLANSDRKRLIEIKNYHAFKSRTLEQNNTVDVKKLNLPKRALFLSPDDEGNKKMSLTSDSIRRNLFPASGNPKVAQNIKTAEGSRGRLIENLDELISRKRKRTKSHEGNENWPRRALTFMEEDTDKNQEVISRNAKVISEVQLSLHHKSKLLWAVSVTLKENNISSRDPFFKICASALFMICRKNLERILNTKMEGGTSEKMLYFAREQIGEIFKKLGVSNKSKDISKLENSGDKIETTAERSEISKPNVEESKKIAEDQSKVQTEKSDQIEERTNNNEKENIDVCENSEFL